MQAKSCMKQEDCTVVLRFIEYGNRSIRHKIQPVSAGGIALQRIDFNIKTIKGGIYGQNSTS